MTSAGISLTWEEVLLPPITRIQKRRHIRITRAYYTSIVLAVVCILVAGISGSLPFIEQYRSSQEQSSKSYEVDEALDSKPQSTLNDMQQQAVKYNEDLAHSPHLIGEVEDPFSGNAKGNFEFRSDKRYWDTLNVDGQGTMGSINIPSISVKLPIGHGSGDSVLRQGIGHLHGTSLPVGGKGTNSVLTGHRGLMNSLLFTRLDELKVGSVFYINTLGKTLAYKVYGVHVINPDDMSLFKITPGVDQVTLVTCTPYGINTQRLVIQAVRGEMPMSVPYPKDAPKDLRPILRGSILLFLVLTALGWVLVAVHHRTLSRGIHATHTSGISK